jgi:hypothetical protein
MLNATAGGVEAATARALVRTGTVTDAVSDRGAKVEKV